MLLEPFAGRGLSSGILELSFTLFLIYQNGRSDRIIVQLPAIYQHLVTREILDAMRKASSRESIESEIPQLYIAFL